MYFIAFCVKYAIIVYNKSKTYKKLRRIYIIQRKIQNKILKLVSKTK